MSQRARRGHRSEAARDADFRPIAAAYRARLMESGDDLAAFDAALAAYLARHPGSDPTAAGADVRWVLFAASEAFGPWLYGKSETDERDDQSSFLERHIRGLIARAKMRKRSNQ